MLGLFSILDIVRMAGAAALAFVLTYAIVAPAKYAAGYNAGKVAMVQAVTKQNHEAAVAARRAKSAIDECDDAGKTWSQEDGTCAE